MFKPRFKLKFTIIFDELENYHINEHHEIPKQSVNQIREI